MTQTNISEHLYTIAPHAPFLDQLVASVLEGPLLGDWPRDNAFWLADVTIILPTQRGRLALSSAFAKALGGGAVLPDIRTLEGREGDEKFFHIDPDKQLPKAISDVDRQFLLSTLIEKWVGAEAKGSDLSLQDLANNPVRILALAQSLSQLIDEMEIEGIPPDALRSAPEYDLDPSKKGDLAKNFQQNLKFLEIALSYWPNQLAELGMVDNSHLQNLKIEKQIKNLTIQYGERPVIAAGSTGSVPSTARLLQAIAGLKRGTLVLPGVDTSLCAHSFGELLQPENAPHGHPQYGLSQLLRHLGQIPSNVKELAPTPPNRRHEIIRHALTLARNTAMWNIKRQEFSSAEMDASLSGVSIVLGKNEREQALAVALAARDALDKKQSVGIVSPDRNFSRRIAVELKRFDIEVDDSAGTPLFQAPAGRLVRQILAAALSDFSAVEIISLLRTKHVDFGKSHMQISRQANLLEFALLRGQRPSLGLAGLSKSLTANLSKDMHYPSLSLSEDEGQQVASLLDEIKEAFAPLMQLLGKKMFTAAQLAKTLLSVVWHLVPEAKLQQHILPGTKQLSEWMYELEGATQTGPALRPRDSEAALQKLMSSYSVRTRGPSQNNITIWGRLEARMQSADLMILCSLNEGIWPEIADPGPWLSRGMRLQAGLEPPERQQGLAAHDFEMAIGHKNVLLSYCNRIGSSPALPSRLIERFCGFVGEDQAELMRARGHKWVRIAREMDAQKTVHTTSRPMPKPPARIRPRKLSITEIETLIRNPFDLYAKHILKLRPINPLGEDTSARERGNLIHDVFARFVDTQLDPKAPDAHQQIMQIAQDVFAQLETQPARRDIWLRRLSKSASGFLDFETKRDKEIKKRFAEIDLHWDFSIGTQDFSIKGKADRIDVRLDGRLEILDFKTGGIPEKKDIVNFMAPQLLVEAAIAKSQGFKGHCAADTHMLAYIKIGADPAAFTPKDFPLPTGRDVNQTADDIMVDIFKRIDAFLLNDNLAMTARIMPNTKQRFAGPYDHLARVAEWSTTEGGEE